MISGIIFVSFLFFFPKKNIFIIQNGICGNLFNNIFFWKIKIKSILIYIFGIIWIINFKK